MGNRLYVGNVSFKTTESDLTHHFEQAGPVADCHLISDRETGQSRGFAFVEMSTQEAAEKAIRELNNSDLDGRTLTVNEARPREERGGGGGGGFGGGGGGGYGGGGGGGRGRGDGGGRGGFGGRGGGGGGGGGGRGGRGGSGGGGRGGY